jgi:hypothetical protein
MIALALLTKLNESFTHTPRTLALVWHSSRKATLSLAALTVLSALLPLGIAYVDLDMEVIGACVAFDRLCGHRIDVRRGHALGTYLRRRERHDPRAAAKVEHGLSREELRVRERC